MMIMLTANCSLKCLTKNYDDNDDDDDAKSGNDDELDSTLTANCSLNCLINFPSRVRISYVFKQCLLILSGAHYVLYNHAPLQVFWFHTA